MQSGEGERTKAGGEKERKQNSAAGRQCKPGNTQCNSLRNPQGFGVFLKNKTPKDWSHSHSHHGKPQDLGLEQCPSPQLCSACSHPAASLAPHRCLQTLVPCTLPPPGGCKTPFIERVRKGRASS